MVCTSCGKCFEHSEAAAYGCRLCDQCWDEERMTNYIEDMEREESADDDD